MARTLPTRLRPAGARRRPAGDRRRRTSQLVALTLVGGLLLAACGSSSHRKSTTGPSSGSGGSGNGGVTVAYSQCMRSHGVPSFPDPNSQGAIEIHASSGSSGGKSVDPNSPQYIAAQKSCQKLAPAAGTPAQQSKDVAEAVKYSQCMRSHGVTGFPDPTVVNGQIEFGGTAGIGRAPRFLSAQSACQGLLTKASGS
jgi:hypothetical protein